MRLSVQRSWGSMQTAVFGEKEGKEQLQDDIRATGTVSAVAAETSEGGSGLCFWLKLNGCSTVVFLPSSSSTLMGLTVCAKGQSYQLLCRLLSWLIFEDRVAYKQRLKNKKNKKKKCIQCTTIFHAFIFQDVKRQGSLNKILDRFLLGTFLGMSLGKSDSVSI